MSVLEVLNKTLPVPDDITTSLTSEQNIFYTVSPREILILILSIIIAYILGLILSHHIRLRISHRLKKDQIDILTGFIRITLIIFAIGISIPAIFDLSITLFAIIIAAVIAIIGVSSQKVVSNLVAGIALLYESPFATGDFITSGEVSGTVISVRLFSVLVRTVDGVYVHIPNDQIYSTTVSNNHANVAKRYVYSVGIGYKDDVKLAEEIIEKILQDYVFVLKNPAPTVFVSDITADSVVLTIRAWFPSNWKLTRDDISLSTEILPKIKEGLEAAGIEMPYAQQVIWFGNKPPITAETGTKQN